MLTPPILLKLESPEEDQDRCVPVVETLALLTISEVGDGTVAVETVSSLEVLAMTVLKLGKTVMFSSWFRNIVGTTHISIEHGPLFEDFRFVVVIDTKSREENFVLVGRQCAREMLLCVSRLHAASLDKRPKGGVIEVVDVA